MIPRPDPMRVMIADISSFKHFPRLDELDSFLKTNPLLSGFPISLEYFQLLASSDAKRMFKVESSDQLCKKLDSYLAKVIKPPQTGSTVDSFYHFWDGLLNDFLSLFCPEPIFRDRDRLLGNFRPDVIRQVGSDWALWRGEEKLEYIAGDPKQELLDKLTWVYGKVPYIFAYYARGAQVTLVALHTLEGTKKMRWLGSFNLPTTVGRVDILLAYLNVAKLLPCLSSMCEDYSVEAEFKPLLEANGKQVRLYNNSVKKSYQSQDVFDCVVDVYERIEGCPNTEQIVTYSHKNREKIKHSMVFQPCCSGLQKTSPESEFVKA